MTSARHARISEIFLAAVDLTAAGRVEFLDRACGNDRELRREVEALLERDARSAVVDRPVAGGQLRAAIEQAHPPPAARIDRIGAYEILGLLGEGGMGTVYRARQARPERIVALKVVNRALVTPAMRKRFEFEAQVLARLQHPGIAQIYEADFADDGGHRVPFFAMELIEGLPLTEYASRGALTTRRKLELVLSVCEAVQHAHQKGVIHRDLKPANILVAGGQVETSKSRKVEIERTPGSSLTPHHSSGASAQPKVLDFGVARALDPDLRSTTLATRAGQIVGTLPYMSPEQVAGNPEQVDTRSDIYSLGVTTYELLAGRLPYEFHNKPLPEAALIIRDVIPPALGSLDRAWRGDLETIVAKALEKDRDRRYASVSDFAADIQRYLADQPILARPPSAVYQLRKLVRRHRVPAALTAALVLLSLGFGAFSTYQATIIARERDAARFQAAAAERARAEAEAARRISVQEAQTTDRVRDLLVSLFRTADPLKATDRSLGVDEILARGEAMVTDQLEGEPQVQATLLLTLGQVHENLGNYERSGQFVERALAQFDRLHGPDHAESIQARNSLAMVRRAQGRLAEAESLLGDVLPTARRVLGEDAETTLIVQNNLALVLKDQRKFAEALPIYRQTLAAQRRVLGEGHRLTLITLDNIGRAHESLGEWHPAEAHYREAIEGFRSLYATEATPHPDLLTAMNNLAGVLAHLGRLDESEALHRETLAGRTAALGLDHPLTLQSMNNLAFTLRQEGELEEAETLMRQSLEGRRRRHGDRHMETLISLSNLANVLRDRGRLTEAEPMFREALAGFREIVDENHFAPYQVLMGLGECLTAMQRFDDAETTLLDAHAGLLRTVGEWHQRTRDCVSRVAALYEAWNRPDQAAKWRAKLSRQEAPQAGHASPTGEPPG